MPPVRIKYYGLIPMTKRTYLIALAAAALLAIAVVATAAVMGLLPPLDIMWSREHHLRGNGFALWLHNYSYWIIAFCLVAQVVDTFLTLRVFARREAEQRSLSGSTAVRAGEPPAS